MATTPPIRRSWRRAAACSPALIAPSQYVSELMELVLAVSGPSMASQYELFVGDPRGRQLLADRPDLVGTLADREALAALPEGSFGRAYLAFVSQYRFDAVAFDQIHDVASMGRRLGWDDDLTYVIQRGLQLHDVWHTLGGYPPDWAGEGGVIAFTYGQVPMTGSRLILGMLQAIPNDVPTRRWHRYLGEARRRGQQADNLTVIAYEDLLADPIDEVRARLGIAPARVAHPGGIPWSRTQFGLGKVADGAYDSPVQSAVAPAAA